MPRITRSASIALACLLTSIGAADLAAAQCADPHWLPGGGCPGVNLFVAATTLWDADGAGPGGPKVVVAGRFDVAGDAIANNIALYDPANGHWEALGSGLGLPGDLSIVSAVAVMPDGSLIAGGDFLDAGGQPASHIARWDGSSWSPLGFGLDFGSSGIAVRALAVLPDGRLAVGGDFTFAGEVYSPRVALWDGTAWESLGSGALAADGYSFVRGLAVATDGSLYAAGLFETIDGIEASNVARWNGRSWSALGAGVNTEVNTVAALPNGGVVLGGWFTLAGGAPAKRIAVWNGTSWSAPGGGVQEGAVFSIAVLGQTEFIVGGTLEQVGGMAVNAVARLSHGTWSALGAGVTDGAGQAIAFSVTTSASAPLSGDLIVGGQFDRAGADGAAGIARWSSDASPALGWSSLADGFNNAWLVEVSVMSNGDVLAGGDFTCAGDGPHDKLARWDGTTWGGAVPASQDLTSWGFVEEIVEHPQGGFLIGGNFQLPGHPETSAIAWWNGTAWDDLGAACDGYGRAFAWDVHGDLIVGGEFDTIGGFGTRSLARWDGAAWSAFGGGLSEFGAVLAAKTMSNGDVVIGGSFTSVDGVEANNIARWDGTSWHAIGEGVDSAVYDLDAAPDGSLVVCGLFTSAGGAAANGLARWDGVAWSELGHGGLDGYAYAVEVEDDGDVVVGGQFSTADGRSAHNIARWDGDAWHAFGSGLAGPDDFSWSLTYALAIDADGTILAGGQFLRADGAVSVNFARFGCEDACPADLDGDGAVGAGDLAVLLGAWGGTGQADLDGSGSVGASDLAVLLGAWGAC